MHPFIFLLQAALAPGIIQFPIKNIPSKERVLSFKQIHHDKYETKITYFLLELKIMEILIRVKQYFQICCILIVQPVFFAL